MRQNVFPVHNIPSPLREARHFQIASVPKDILAAHILPIRHAHPVPQALTRLTMVVTSVSFVSRENMAMTLPCSIACCVPKIHDPHPLQARASLIAYVMLDTLGRIAPLARRATSSPRLALPIVTSARKANIPVHSMPLRILHVFPVSAVRFH